MKRAFTIFATMIIFFTIAGWAGDVSPVVLKRCAVAESQITVNQPEIQKAVANPMANYSGTLRLFVVEKDSRWTDYNGSDYHYAFLDYALDSMISIPYQGQIVINKTWDGTAAGYGDINDTNIVVIAAVFNANAHQAYADPPAGHPFTGYFNDAAALAKPGVPGDNAKITGYTHTVLVEEATAQWCPNCPTIKTALHTLYNFAAYNFVFVAMVGQDYSGYTLNAKAYNRVKNQLNLAGWPTCFGDGGTQVAVGTYGSVGTDIPYLRSMIQAAGAMDVHDLDLHVTLDTVGVAQLQIQVTITNNEFLNIAPTVPDAPSGVTEGVTTKPYAFTVNSTDSDDQQLYYQFDWGGGPTGVWLGPYASGMPVAINHAWTTPNDYVVKVKVKDEMNLESDWSSTTAVSVAKIGDANGDTNLNVGDAVYMINYVFKGGPHPMPYNECGDANCDSKQNVGDAVYMINYVFKGGPGPGCH